MFEHTEEPDELRRKFSRRALLLGAGQAGLLGLIGARLYHLQVEEHARYALLADANRVNVRALAGERGRILDRFGQVLASNVERFNAVLVPAEAGDLNQVLARFQRLVPLDADEVGRLLQRARRQRATTPLVVARDLSFEQIAAIGLHAPQLPGIWTETASKRRYHHGRAVGHIVGYVGAPDRPALDDEPVTRLPGARLGKAGIERARDEVLRGTPGVIEVEVDSRGRPVRQLDRREAVGGRDVITTIDTVLQVDVLSKLAAHRRAAVVVMDVTSGEVPVLASVPTFDPNDIVDGAAPQSWQRLLRQRDDPMTNRATQGLYPPGSTFKMIVALAGLEAGVIDPLERIACTGAFAFHGQTYRCWNRAGHGPCHLHRALKESCDCYFYEVARRTGIRAIAAKARQLGLGQSYDCGLANVKRGLVPDPDWKRGRFNKPWLAGETILAGIGQGYVLATPLQLAVMTARLATGRAVVPTLVREADGNRAPADLLAGRPEWFKAVRQALFAVVNEAGGTGSKARPNHDAYDVAGKTGTSQVSRLSSESAQADLRFELRDHALFVAYAGVGRPQYAVATVVEHGGGGGAIAAPLTRDILDLVMARDPSARSAWNGERLVMDEAGLGGSRSAVGED